MLGAVVWYDPAIQGFDQALAPGCALVGIFGASVEAYNRPVASMASNVLGQEEGVAVRQAGAQFELAEAGVTLGVQRAEYHVTGVELGSVAPVPKPYANRGFVERILAEPVLDATLTQMLVEFLYGTDLRNLDGSAVARLAKFGVYVTYGESNLASIRLPK